MFFSFCYALPFSSHARFHDNYTTGSRNCKPETFLGKSHWKACGSQIKVGHGIPRLSKQRRFLHECAGIFPVLILAVRIRFANTFIVCKLLFWGVLQVADAAEYINGNYEGKLGEILIRYIQHFSH